MLSQHQLPAGIYRADEALRKRAIEAAAQVDSCLNAHLNGFLLWLVGDTDELRLAPLRTASTAQIALRAFAQN